MDMIIVLDGPAILRHVVAVIVVVGLSMIEMAHHRSSSAQDIYLGEICKIWSC
jgi:hypothetical protein